MSFPDGGYYVQRSGWGATDAVRGRAVPDPRLRPARRRRPRPLRPAQRRDLAGGRPLVIDPGRYTYCRGPAEPAPLVPRHRRAQHGVRRPARPDALHARAAARAVAEGRLLGRVAAPRPRRDRGARRSAPPTSAVHIRVVAFVDDGALGDRGPAGRHARRTATTCASTWRPRPRCHGSTAASVRAPGLGLVFATGPGRGWSPAGCRRATASARRAGRDRRARRLRRGRLRDAGRAARHGERSRVRRGPRRRDGRGRGGRPRVAWSIGAEGLELGMTAAPTGRPRPPRRPTPLAPTRPCRDATPCWTPAPLRAALRKPARRGPPALRAPAGEVPGGREPARALFGHRTRPRGAGVHAHLLRLPRRRCLPRGPRRRHTGRAAGPGRARPGARARCSGPSRTTGASATCRCLRRRPRSGSCSARDCARAPLAAYVPETQAPPAARTPGGERSRTPRSTPEKAPSARGASPPSSPAMAGGEPRLPRLLSPRPAARSSSSRSTARRSRRSAAAGLERACAGWDAALAALHAIDPAGGRAAPRPARRGRLHDAAGAIGVARPELAGEAEAWRRGWRPTRAPWGGDPPACTATSSRQRTGAARRHRLRRFGPRGAGRPEVDLARVLAGLAYSAVVGRLPAPDERALGRALLDRLRSRAPPPGAWLAALARGGDPARAPRRHRGHRFRPRGLSRLEAVLDRAEEVLA